MFYLPLTKSMIFWLVFCDSWPTIFGIGIEYEPPTMKLFVVASMKICYVPSPVCQWRYNEKIAIPLLSRYCVEKIVTFFTTIKEPIKTPLWDENFSLKWFSVGSKKAFTLQSLIRIIWFNIIFAGLQLPSNGMEKHDAKTNFKEKRWS